MRNDINRNASGRAALATFFAFAMLCAVSLVAQGLASSAFRPAAYLDQPVRVTLHRKTSATLPPGAKDLELNFTGANGVVTALNAKSGKQTFKFERTAEAGLSCPRGRVKDCDSLSLKSGGELTACACVPPGPVTQTKEHILLARQVGVPSMMTESSRPENMAVASSDSGYEIALSDKTMLLASPNGQQTCWINKKLPLSLCY